MWRTVSGTLTLKKMLFSPSVKIQLSALNHLRASVSILSAALHFMLSNSLPIYLHSHTLGDIRQRAEKPFNHDYGRISAEARSRLMVLFARKKSSSAITILECVVVYKHTAAQLLMLTGSCEGKTKQVC